MRMHAARFAGGVVLLSIGCTVAQPPSNTGNGAFGATGTGDAGPSAASAQDAEADDATEKDASAADAKASDAKASDAKTADAYVEGGPGTALGSFGIPFDYGSPTLALYMPKWDGYVNYELWDPVARVLVDAAPDIAGVLHVNPTNVTLTITSPPLSPAVVTQLEQDVYGTMTAKQSGVFLSATAPLTQPNIDELDSLGCHTASAYLGAKVATSWGTTHSLARCAQLPWVDAMTE